MWLSNEEAFVKLHYVGEHPIELPDGTRVNRGDTLMPAIDEQVRGLARANAARREQRVRAAVEAWLPRPLRRLIDHPRLLRAWLRLPHRRRPVGIEQDGTFRVEIQ